MMGCFGGLTFIDAICCIDPVFIFSPDAGLLIYARNTHFSRMREVAALLIEQDMCRRRTKFGEGVA